MKAALALLFVSLSAVDALAIPVCYYSRTCAWTRCPTRFSRLLSSKAVAVAAYQDANDKFQRTKAFLKLVEARFAAGLATANEVAEADHARHEAETASHAVRERAVMAGGLVKDLAGNYMCATVPGLDFSDSAASENGGK